MPGVPSLDERHRARARRRPERGARTAPGAALDPRPGLVRAAAGRRAGHAAGRAGRLPAGPRRPGERDDARRGAAPLSSTAPVSPPPWPTRPRASSPPRSATPRRGRALRAGRRSSRRDADSDLLPWRAGAALAHLRNGDARAAGELAREHVELARRSGSPYAMAGALRTLAAVDAGPDRIQHLLRARAVLAGTVGRAALGPDRHRPGRAAAAHPRPGRRGAGAGAAPLGRGPRRAARSCGRCRAGSAGCSTGSASSPARCRPRRWPR